MDEWIWISVLKRNKDKKTALGEQHKRKLDDEWPECIFHHVGSQSASYPVSVRCEVLRRFPASS